MNFSDILRTMAYTLEAWKKPMHGEDFLNRSKPTYVFIHLNIHTWAQDDPKEELSQLTTDGIHKQLQMLCLCVLQFLFRFLSNTNSVSYLDLSDTSCPLDMVCWT